MDLLLTHGYCLAEDPHEQAVMKPYPPLGLLYLSAYLKAQGYGVEVFDTTFRTLAELVAYVQTQRPLVVGLYTNLMTKFNVLRLITQCRAAGAKVILGGPEPAQYAAEYLAHGADVIVVGEGELTVADLLARDFRDLEGVPGIVFRRSDGQIAHNPARPYIHDLNTLPLPDRAAIDLPRYLQAWRARHGVGSLSLICARGCPYHCQWCSHAVYGHTHRRRSPDNVVAEVEHLIERYQPDQLWYADDVFTINRRWLLDYAHRLKTRGIRLPFECISRPDRLDETVIDALAEMGCYQLWLGSESGSQRVLDLMQRGTHVEDLQAKTRLLQKRGIKVGMFIMLGYEGETWADLEATTAHLQRANPDVFLTTVAYPIKGTAFYHNVQDRILAPDTWENTSDRQLTVRGRPSRRFYSLATRWMVNAVALHQEWHSTRHPLRLAKTLANTVFGKTGMWLTRGEREAAPD
jgi:radical SAM superfamily enzyme YgiQ (UPF0313 family)